MFFVVLTSSRRLGHDCTKKTPEAIRSSGCSSFEPQTRAYCVLPTNIIPYFPVSVKSVRSLASSSLRTWAHPSSTGGHALRLSARRHRASAQDKSRLHQPHRWLFSRKLHAKFTRSLLATWVQFVIIQMVHSWTSGNGFFANAGYSGNGKQ